MRALALTLLLLAAPNAFAAQPSILFQNHGKDVTAAPLNRLLGEVPAQTVKVFQPHEGKEIEFKGIPLAPLLDKIYGTDWRTNPAYEDALFICADGYRAPVPLSRIRDHAAWLAFERTDRKDFTLTEQKPQPREVTLFPLMVVWDTLKDPESRAAGFEGWPWQVVGIDLVTFADRYPKLALPAKAPAAAVRGLKIFRQYCLSCHAIDGQGGSVGPELNIPVSVTTYFKEPWLKKWIAEPQSVRAGSKMPPVIPAGPRRAEQVDDVVAYLKAKASQAKQPDSGLQR